MTDRKRFLFSATLLALATLSGYVFYTTRGRVERPMVADLDRPTIALQPRNPDVEHHEVLRQLDRDLGGDVAVAKVTLEDGTDISASKKAGGSGITATHTAPNGDVFQADLSADGLVAQAGLKSSSGAPLLKQEQAAESEPVLRTVFDPDSNLPAYRITIDDDRQTTQVLHNGMLIAEAQSIAGQRKYLRIYSGYGFLLYEETPFNVQNDRDPAARVYTGNLFGPSRATTNQVLVQVRRSPDASSFSPESIERISMVEDVSRKARQPARLQIGLFADKEEFAARRSQALNQLVKLQSLLTVVDDKLDSVRDLVQGTGNGALRLEEVPLPKYERSASRRTVFRDRLHHLRRLQVTYFDGSKGTLWKDGQGKVTTLKVVTANGIVFRGSYDERVVWAKAFSTSGVRIAELSNPSADESHLVAYQDDGKRPLITEDRNGKHRVERTMYPDGHTVRMEIEWNDRERVATRMYSSDGKLRYFESSSEADEDSNHHYVGTIYDGRGKPKYRINSQQSEPKMLYCCHIVSAEKLAADGIRVRKKIYAESEKRFWTEPGDELSPANAFTRKMLLSDNYAQARKFISKMELAITILAIDPAH